MIISRITTNIVSIFESKHIIRYTHIKTNNTQKDRFPTNAAPISLLFKDPCAVVPNDLYLEIFPYSYQRAMNPLLRSWRQRRANTTCLPYLQHRCSLPRQKEKEKIHVHMVGNPAFMYIAAACKRRGIMAESQQS